MKTAKGGMHEGKMSYTEYEPLEERINALSDDKTPEHKDVLRDILTFTLERGKPLEEQFIKESALLYLFAPATRGDWLVDYEKGTKIKDLLSEGSIPSDYLIKPLATLMNKSNGELDKTISISYLMEGIQEVIKRSVKQSENNTSSIYKRGIKAIDSFGMGSFSDKFFLPGIEQIINSALPVHNLYDAERIGGMPFIIHPWRVLLASDMLITSPAEDYSNKKPPADSLEETVKRFVVDSVAVLHDVSESFARAFKAVKKNALSSFYDFPKEDQMLLKENQEVELAVDALIKLYNIPRVLEGAFDKNICPEWENSVGEYPNFKRSIVNFVISSSMVLAGYTSSNYEDSFRGIFSFQEKSEKNFLASSKKFSYVSKGLFRELSLVPVLVKLVDSYDNTLHMDVDREKSVKRVGKDLFMVELLKNFDEEGYNPRGHVYTAIGRIKEKFEKLTEDKVEQLVKDIVLSTADDNNDISKAVGYSKMNLVFLAQLLDRPYANKVITSAVQDTLKAHPEIKDAFLSRLKNMSPSDAYGSLNGLYNSLTSHQKYEAALQVSR